MEFLFAYYLTAISLCSELAIVDGLILSFMFILSTFVSKTYLIESVFRFWLFDVPGLDNKIEIILFRHLIFTDHNVILGATLSIQDFYVWINGWAKIELILDEDTFNGL